ncbi:MAG: ion transporter [Bacteroidales bacterium]
MVAKQTGWRNTLADIFSNNIRSSKLSYCVNMMIVLFIIISTLEIILQSEQALAHLKWLFDLVYTITSIVFLIEITLRFVVASDLDPKFKGFKGKLKFAVQIFTLVDIVAVLPFLMGLIGFEMLLYLKAIRVLRILKIVRYMPSVDLLVRSVNNKKSELLISIQVILLTALLLSIGLYYAESRIPGSEFSSITKAFLWSVAKFIGDIGGYGLFDPMTRIGQFLATLNGILGIAIFAIPAGIIASGFMDEIAEEKKKNVLANNTKLIINYFKKFYSGKTALGGKMTHSRHNGIDTIQAATLLTEQEIFEVIRNNTTLRFRSMKSSENVLFNDIKIVEHFVHNTSYGFRKRNESSAFHIVCPLGNVERGISHFCHSIADNLNYNFYIREFTMPYKDTSIGAFTSDFHESFDPSNKDLPVSFFDWINDLSEIKSDDVVMIVVSGASGGADFDIEFGLPAGTQGLVFENSFIHQPEKIIPFCEKFADLVQSVTITTQKKTTESFQFNCQLHSKGDVSPKNLSGLIHRITGANVFCLYVNIKILTGDDAYYYAGMSALMKTMETTYGDYTLKASVSQ